MASASDYSSDDNFYGEEDDEDGVAEIELKPCSNCGRNFNPEALDRHQSVCAKLKDRKAFDSKKQRLRELEKLNITTTGGASKPKKKNWRWEHEQFIKNIRAARVSTTNVGGSPAPSQAAVNPDYVQCPHCERSFNETAAERHIDFCKEQKSRIPKQSDTKYADKKEKQDKRSTYKPPLPGQKKKSLSATTAGIPKLRTNSNTGRKSKTTSPSLQSNNTSVGNRPSKSDTTIAGMRKKKIAEEAKDHERPTSNVNQRYARLSSGSSTENDKIRSGKSRGGSEPKWFEELKRNDSGNQLRRNKIDNDLDAVDSGMDLNENYSQNNLMTNGKVMKESPVGVVRPSSRTNDKDFLGEKTERVVASGRRKMANFCHDCGTRYPVPEAKFCCECGVKRMALV